MRWWAGHLISQAGWTMCDPFLPSFVSVLPQKLAKGGVPGQPACLLLAWSLSMRHCMRKGTHQHPQKLLDDGGGRPVTGLLSSSRGIVTMRGNGALFPSQRVQSLTVELLCGTEHAQEPKL